MSSGKKPIFRAKYQSFEQKVKGLPQNIKANLIIRGREGDFAKEYHRRICIVRLEYEKIGKSLKIDFLYLKYEKQFPKTNIKLENWIY